LGLPCIGSVPLLKSGSSRGAPLRASITDPMGQFAESLRELKVAIDFNSTNQRKIVGFVSAIPGEGKTTIASNIAEQMAHAGMRVILIDCDLRNPSLSSQVAPHAKTGLVEVIEGKAKLDEAVITRADSGLAILPVVREKRRLHTSEIMKSPVLASLLELVRASYDYVIIDLPPLLPVTDARVIASKVDGFVFVVEWGKTNKHTVKNAVTVASQVQDRIVGVALSKVDFRIASRYPGYSHYASSYKYYS
jgi:polysaccharide biosynthesis transport protein